MGEIRFGPARVPSQDSPEQAIELLVDRGYTACEIDFETRFWMDYDFAARLGELAREHGISLSVHAPLAGFMGHAERGKKLNMAVGMLDHSAGISKACGAEVVVFHPGFLLERSREEALDAVVEQLGELLQEGRLPASWIAPTIVLEWRERARLYKTLVDQRSTWVQRIHAELYQHGVTLPETSIRWAKTRELLEDDGLEISPAGRQRC